MKIALPTSQGTIDAHFGHCAEFTIFTVEDGSKIVREERLTPPAGCGCKSSIIPQLAERGVTAMLAGNMGGGAVSMLKQHGIEVYRGLGGPARTAAEAWLRGEVLDSGEECASHTGHGCS